MRRLLSAALAATVLALLPACISTTRVGDSLAKKGDWEGAMREYRAQSEAHPENRDILDKKNHAEHMVAQTWIARGTEAQKQGRLGDAGEWWRRAIELKPDEQGPKSARGIVAANAQALEQFGEQALAQKHYEDAFHAWGPLLLVYPERVDLANKASDAHKQFAAELDQAAAQLESKNLLGAALVDDLRALQHDPMHPDAYKRTADLRKKMVGKSAVSIPAITLNDDGWTAFGIALAPALNAHLGQYPPYGPTKSENAIPAQLVVTVEDFSWSDSTTHTLEPHPQTAPGMGKIPNPQRAAQQKIVDDLQRELKFMEGGATLQGDRTSPWIHAGAAPEPTPTPSKKAKKGAQPAATPEPARKTMAARTASPDDVAKKQAELDKAQADLAQMPEQVDAPNATTWYVPVKETTRTVSAKVRLEVREPDFPEPITRELALDYSVSDKSWDADAAHGLAADPLRLPPVEQLLQPLAEKFQSGVDVLKEARTRRGQKWLDIAREKHAAGQDDDAIDACVWAMFLLGNDVPDEARSLVASRLDGADPKTVLAGP